MLDARVGHCMVHCLSVDGLPVAIDHLCDLSLGSCVRIFCTCVVFFVTASCVQLMRIRLLHEDLTCVLCFQCGIGM